MYCASLQLDCFCSNFSLIEPRGRGAIRLASFCSDAEFVDSWRLGIVSHVERGQSNFGLPRIYSQNFFNCQFWVGVRLRPHWKFWYTVTKCIFVGSLSGRGPDLVKVWLLGNKFGSTEGRVLYLWSLWIYKENIVVKKKTKNFLSYVCGIINQVLFSHLESSRIRRIFCCCHHNVFLNIGQS